MFKTCVSLALCLVALFSQAQEQETQKLNSTETVSVKLIPEIQEPIPTPEEQGFKGVEVNGKMIYRKELNGIIIEFEPTNE